MADMSKRVGGMDSAKDCLSHTSLARRGPEEKSGSTCFSMISTNRPPFPSSQVDHEELAFIYKISWRDDFLSGATRRKTSAGNNDEEIKQERLDKERIRADMVEISERTKTA
ncbi:hypothetical protein NC651_009763 [Populus alba x Populus x berolinensis]|nr:hypothetical protein NC651_009763 [Populus alba x Populus x berolinensis]